MHIQHTCIQHTTYTYPLILLPPGAPPKLLWLQVAEAATSARLARAEDAVRKLEGDLAAGRVRCAQLESSVRSKDLGLDKLSKALDAQRREEHDAAAQVRASLLVGCGLPFRRCTCSSREGEGGHPCRATPGTWEGSQGRQQPEQGPLCQGIAAAGEEGQPGTAAA